MDSEVVCYIPLCNRSIPYDRPISLKVTYFKGQNHYFSDGSQREIVVKKEQTLCKSVLWVAPQNLQSNHFPIAFPRFSIWVVHYLIVSHSFKLSPFCDQRPDLYSSMRLSVSVNHLSVHYNTLCRQSTSKSSAYKAVNPLFRSVFWARNPILIFCQINVWFGP